MLTAKDPRENIVLTFDFSALAAVIENPQVSVEVISGSDANAEAMKSSSPQVSGAMVLQSVTGGIDEVDYRFSCTGESNGGRIVIAETLRVRKR